MELTFHTFMKEKGNSSMKISNSAKYVIGVSAAVALLAGCTGNGGSQLTPSGPGMAPSSQRTMGANHKVDLSETLITPRSVKPNLSKKVTNERVMKPNCCALQKTLFVTDAEGGSSFTGAVYAFDYVTGASLGSVAAPPEGWFEPQGACSDNNGNVYIANTAMSTIDEYNHSGTFITALSDSGQFPVGCAFDKASGNLAVSNILTTSDGPGSISIYSGGSLQNTYTPSNMNKVYFIGYQAKTHVLWLSGLESSAVFQYDSMSPSGTFTNVGIHGATVGFPGTVQWTASNQWMNAADQDTFSSPTIYQVDSSGNVVGSTVTECVQISDFCDPVQMTIKGTGLVEPDAIAEAANRFAYPAGGAPTMGYTGPSFIEPIGSAVSPDKSGGD
jgi:hypothetical protein